MSKPKLQMTAKEILAYVKSWSLDDDDQHMHAAHMAEILESIVPFLPSNKKFTITPRKYE